MIGSQIFKNKIFFKYIINSFWMFAENFARVFAGFFVSVYVIRFLGPERFGLFSYVLCITQLLVPLAGLGLDAILFRDLSKNPDKKDCLLGSSILIELVASSFIALMSSILVTLITDDKLFQIIFFICISEMVFNSLLATKEYFNSKVQAKYIAIANILSLLITSAFRIFLVVNDFPLPYFALMVPIEKLLQAIFLAYFYMYKKNKLLAFKFDKNISLSLLKDSWPLIFYSFAGTLYMSADQFMLKFFLGTAAVGYYAVGVKLVMFFYIIPSVLTNTVYPDLIKAYRNSAYNDFREKALNIYKLSLLLSMAIVVFFMLFGKLLIVRLFGTDFQSSIAVLLIYSWGLIFTFFGSMNNKILMLHNMQTTMLFRTLMGLAFNCVLNCILIPWIGLEGAALSSVLSEIFVILTYKFRKETKDIYIMQIETFLSPIYMIKKMVKV